MSRARVAVAAAVALTAMTVSGCGLGKGLYNVSLPGGADLGDHPYHVTAKFTDALDLVPQSGVKVNDVAVGRVTAITLERNGRIADVTVEVNGDVHLPANAVASIQQTSLLGEKYVALAAPLGAAPTGTLRDHAVIGVGRTTDGVEVEQVFGALSLVLNGGGIGQLHEIAQELNDFAHGHEGEIRQFFASVQRVVAQMNAHRSSITQALDALDSLAGTLRTQNTQISRVLASFAPGIAVLASERTQLITLLTSLNRLSTVTVQTLDASKQDMIEDLESLSPVLTQLAAAGSALPRSLQVLATYPFTDGAVAGIKGDYLNTFATTALNTPGGKVVSAAAWPSTARGGSASATASSGAQPDPQSGAPTSIAPPPGLLPATSASAPGLPSTLTLTPSTVAAASTAPAPSEGSAR